MSFITKLRQLKSPSIVLIFHIRNYRTVIESYQQIIDIVVFFDSKTTGTKLKLVCASSMLRHCICKHVRTMSAQCPTTCNDLMMNTLLTSSSSLHLTVVSSSMTAKCRSHNMSVFVSILPQAPSWSGQFMQNVNLKAATRTEWEIIAELRKINTCAKDRPSVRSEHSLPMRSCGEHRYPPFLLLATQHSTC